MVPIFSGLLPSTLLPQVPLHLVLPFLFQVLLIFFFFCFFFLWFFFLQFFFFCGFCHFFFGFHFFFFGFFIIWFLSSYLFFWFLFTQFFFSYVFFFFISSFCFSSSSWTGASSCTGVGWGSTPCGGCGSSLALYILLFLWGLLIKLANRVSSLTCAIFAISTRTDKLSCLEAYAYVEVVSSEGALAISLVEDEAFSFVDFSDRFFFASARALTCASRGLYLLFLS